MQDWVTAMKHEWFNRGILLGYVQRGCGDEAKAEYAKYEVSANPYDGARALRAFASLITNEFVRDSAEYLAEIKESRIVKDGLCPKCGELGALCRNSDPGGEIVTCAKCHKEVSMTELMIRS